MAVAFTATATATGAATAPATATGESFYGMEPENWWDFEIPEYTGYGVTLITSRWRNFYSRAGKRITPAGRNLGYAIP